MEDPIFESYKKQNQERFETLRSESVRIFNPFSLGEHFTFIIRPTEDIKSKIADIINELKVYEPNQFFYPLDQLHLSLFVPLNKEMDEKELIFRSSDVIKKYKISFNLNSLSATVSGLLVDGYPSGFSLHELRDELRLVLGEKGIDYTSNPHLSTLDYLGWIYFMRFKNIPDKNFFKQFSKYFNFQIGELRPSKVEIYKTQNTILDPTSYKHLTDITL